MILLDAVYINNGGGKILLDYLISNLEKTNKNIYYLLDTRLKINDYAIRSNNKVHFVNPKYLNRHRFYEKNINSFSTVLCFGNLPPSIKINAVVYTYFHQPMYLKIPKEITLLNRLKFWIKTIILKFIKKNANYWLVQNETIRKDLIKKYNLNPENVLVIPFYPPFDRIDRVPIRKKYSYLYVSNAPAHKNHIRLINAFCNFFDKKQIGELKLTVSPQYENIIKLIWEKKIKGYPIVNVGFINRSELQELYLENEYLIFPSLAESFGLGLVEAIENGCKVIGANLPYMYQVCEPSIIFNPFDTKSIEIAFENSLLDNIPMSNQIITNKINDLIERLK
jgi:glycosyltransferase involved in cell wall biosynthesis